MLNRVKSNLLNCNYTSITILMSGAIYREKKTNGFILGNPHSM